MRGNIRIVAVPLALLLLSTGTAAAVPALASVAEDDRIVGGESASAPAADPQRYFLRRDVCGGSAPQNTRLSVVPGPPDGGDECGYVPPGWNALNEVYAALGGDGIVESYHAEDGLPVKLDGTAAVTGRVVITSWRSERPNVGLAGGISRAHFTLRGIRADKAGAVRLGDATVEYLVTPTDHTHEVDFTMPAAARFDLEVFVSLTLQVRLDGPAVNHGMIRLDGASFIDLPRHRAG